MTQEQEKKLGITIEHKISLYDIGCLLTDAFEGGSNYWYMIHDAHRPATWKKKEKHFYYEYAITYGGYLIISDEALEEPTIKRPFIRLDLELLKKGLQIMAKDYINHYADLVKDNADAVTADVFLQCCIFGEVIYG